MKRCRTPGEQKRSRASSVVAALLAAGGCGVVDAHSCTEAGCLDMATIRLQSADGSQRSYALTLNVDGRAVTCATPALTAPSSTSTQPCSDPQVSISHGPLADCTETRTADAVSQSCVPNGKFAQTIEFLSTPARVSVVVMDADSATFEHTFDLQYVTSRPNGPECGPVCEQAVAEWVLE